MYILGRGDYYPIRLPRTGTVGSTCYLLTLRHLLPDSGYGVSMALPAGICLRHTPAELVHASIHLVCRIRHTTTIRHGNPN